MQIPFYKTLRDFFSPLKTKDVKPKIEYGWSGVSPVQGLMDALRGPWYLNPKPEVLEAQHRRNMESLELAKLEHQKEVADKTLMSQYRVMIVTVVATFIALFSSVAAIIIALQKETPPAPVVNVAPSLQATPPEVKVYVTPQQEGGSQ